MYGSPQTGEVTLLTTRRARALAWMSTIPHWFYVTALRANQPVWYRLVVWSSAFVCALAVLGLALGVVQYRRRKPVATAIPYSGWMRWHYVTGVVFGIFTLTWAFSGLLSMEPFEWTQAEGIEIDREMFTGGPADLSAFQGMDPQTWARLVSGRAIKEVSSRASRTWITTWCAMRRRTPSAKATAERLHQPYPVNGRRDPNRVLVAVPASTCGANRSASIRWLRACAADGQTCRLSSRRC